MKSLLTHKTKISHYRQDLDIILYYDFDEFQQYMVKTYNLHFPEENFFAASITEENKHPIIIFKIQDIEI